MMNHFVIFIMKTRLLVCFLCVTGSCFFIYQSRYSVGPVSIKFILFNNNTIEKLTFERRKSCNYKDQKSCYSTNKSLIISFWSEKSKNRWLAQNISSAFPTFTFDYLIFIHDNSNWQTHTNSKDFIWISIYGQHRLWYLKRFVLPIFTRSYKYIWVVDDDAKLDFSPLHYQCVIQNLNISLSAPGRVQGALSHPITRLDSNYEKQIGRWTDFIETGPVFVASSQAWECLYRYIDAATGTGWGLDLVWCELLAEQCLSLSISNQEKICAILDVFHVDHQSTGVNSVNDGAPEAPVYLSPYQKWKTQMKTFNPLAKDTKLIENCRT